MKIEPKYKIKTSPKLFDFSDTSDAQVTMIIKERIGQPERIKKQEQSIKSPWMKDK